MRSLKILLLGKNGQVGWELQRSLAPLGEVIALDRNGQPAGDGVKGLGGAELNGDLSNLQALAATVRALRPDVIVNAAAHTAVDRAESEPDLAHTLNALAPGVLADEAQRLGAWLVHYSTDYVFDGSGDKPWTEKDTPAPLSVYGRSKLEGEQRIQASGAKHLIFRTSWVYAARGGNFAKTMLRLAQERDRLTVINDQFGAPTGAELLADVTAQAVRSVLSSSSTSSPESPSLQGIYHLAASGETTWHAYAQHVVDKAALLKPSLQIKAQEIAAVPTSAFPTPAVRPHNSRLDTRKLQAAFGLTLPPWQHGVDRMLAEVL